MNDAEGKDLTFSDDVATSKKFDKAIESAVDELMAKASKLLGLEWQVKLSSRAGLQGMFIDSKLGDEDEARFDDTVAKIKQYVEKCCFDTSVIEDQAKEIGRIKRFDIYNEIGEITTGLSSWDTHDENSGVPSWYVAPRSFGDGPAEIFKDVYVQGVARRQDAQRDLLSKMQYSLESVPDIVKSNRDAILTVIKKVKTELDSYDPVWDYIWFVGSIMVGTVGLGVTKLGVQLALTAGSLIYPEAEEIIGQTSEYCVVDLMQLLRDGCDELMEQRNAVFSELASSLNAYYDEVSEMQDEHICPRPSQLAGSGQSVHGGDDSHSGPKYWSLGLSILNRHEKEEICLFGDCRCLLQAQWR